MKRILFILTLSLSFCGMSQEVVKENQINNPITLHERAPETVNEITTPLSEEVIENENSIITTSTFKNFTVVKTEPKQ